MKNYKHYIIWVIGVSIFFIYYTATLCISIKYDNATCYKHEYFINLSEWLIMSSGTSIISLICITILLILMCMDIEPLDYLSDYSCYVLLSILFTITVIIMQMLLIIFSIIGFVELIYQHKHCLSEVPIICNLSILTIIVNLLH